MRKEILTNFDNPGKLEKLYRSNKSDFKEDFTSLYPELSGNSLAEFWHERLTFESDAISWGSKKEILWIFLAILIAGLLAKIPAIFSINEEFFYPRNISFIILPLLTAYFAWKNKLSSKTIAVLAGITGISLVYINALPGIETNTLILACIHLPLLLWALLGISFAGNELNNPEKRLDFLRFNSDAAVMSVLLGIASFLLTGLTFGLFELIGIRIEEFYVNYVVAFGLPAIPILGTYLTQKNPHLVNKVSPIIAKIFSPLVLVMLVIYLGAIIYSGKDPYNDREFLLIFNLLLIGVMALIFFSVAENFSKQSNGSGNWILLLLSVVTVIINGIALSAILFRISEWGITPNRMAVLGGNILILIHLLMVSWSIYKAVSKKAETDDVGKKIVDYLPVYIVWTIVVVFLFPLMFGFE
jgi:hypothetical protein